MKVRKYRTFVCDFETTVYKGQEHTEVWAAACVELFTEDVKIYHSIDEIFEYFKSLKQNVRVYFHNLKFDGSFWIDFLMIKLGFKQALEQYGDKETDVKWLHEKDMPNNSFKFSMSDRGLFYTLHIKTGGYIIEIRDSLKLLPFSVKKIGNSFGTKHKKLEMEYTGFRYAGCEITDSEKKYISNDVLVVKEALEMMHLQGHTKLTIGSCCMEEYRRIIKTETAYDYNELFPDIYDILLDSDKYGETDAGEYVRRSYRGGWSYLVKGKENRLHRNGTTADVNSLYPSVMHSMSGNYYPVGKPHFWTGDIPKQATAPGRYYFVKIRTRFRIKKGFLPFIQIKGNMLYRGNECLTTSDIGVMDSKTGRTHYYRYYKDQDGNKCDSFVELTLTMADFELMKEHYELIGCEILSGCWFYAMCGIFDKYIDKYAEIKKTSTGAKRELAKLFLNNLYGKLASSTDSSFKIAYIREDNTIGFIPIKENEKAPGYIPAGSAVTSYARNFTIRAAQKNYYGVNKPGFIYADTDSIHCDIPPDEIAGIRVHKTDFCCWKLETCWDVGFFVRQKTYIEHVTHEDLNEVEEPYYNIKCAGMPDRCKGLFKTSMAGDADPSGYIGVDGTENQWTEDEKGFLFDGGGKPIKRGLKDFCIGLSVPGKLRPKYIRGGILLVDTPYTMK